MTNLRRSAAVALFSGALAIVSINAMSCKATPVTAAPDTGAPIKIGVTIALTGPSQGYGATVQNAIKLASQQINATGGILGRHVEFKIMDDASDTDKVIKTNVQALLDEGVSAILGPVGSSQVIAIGDLIAKRKVIQISGSATSSTLSTFQPLTDRYFFRTVPPDTLQARALSIFAARGPAAFKQADGGASGMGADGGPPSSGCKRMAVVYNDDDYGKPFADAVKVEFPAKSGGSVVFEAKVPADMKASYNTEVAGLVAANPDCLAMIVYDPTADAFIRELKKGQESTPTLPPTFFIIGTDGSYTNDLISNGRLDKTNPNSPTIVEGMFGTNPDSNPETTQYGEFKNLYLTQFPLDPGANDLGPSVANFYDAAVLAALAIQAAGSTDNPVKIRDALYDVSRGKKNSAMPARALGPAQIGEALEGIRNGDNIDYNGASGDCNFDESGNVVSDYIIWNVQNGQFTTLAPRVKASDLQ